MLSERDKAVIRADLSYRVSIISMRLFLTLFGLLALVYPIGSTFDVPSSVVDTLAWVFAVPLVVAFGIAVVSGIQMRILSFNVRGRKLFEPTAKGQLSAMFVADLVWFRRPVVLPGTDAPAVVDVPYLGNAGTSFRGETTSTGGAPLADTLLEVPPRPLRVRPAQPQEGKTAAGDAPTDAPGERGEGGAQPDGGEPR